MVNFPSDIIVISTSIRFHFCGTDDVERVFVCLNFVVVKVKNALSDQVNSFMLWDLTRVYLIFPLLYLYIILLKFNVVSRVSLK